MEEDIRTLVKEELEKFNRENINTIYATEIEFRTKLQKSTLPRIEAVLLTYVEDPWPSVHVRFHYDAF